MLIDVHCHLTGDEYEEKGGVVAVLDRARRAGVGRFICSGYDLDSSLIACKLSETYDDVYFSAGFHPSDIEKCKDGDLEKLKALLSHEKCVAVGEIGLDYHFEDNPAPEKQKAMFLEQIKLASEAKIPIVVHSRDACQDTLELLKEHAALLKNGGLMHCYSYSKECVAEFEKLGFYFSFGGTVTFKNAKKVQQSALAVGRDRILSETDCPYLSPEPLRGRFPNEPQNVKHTVEFLSHLREDEGLEEQIYQNANKLFFRMRG